MYTEHFGLTGQPFQLTPDARFWFDSRTHKKRWPISARPGPGRSFMS